MNWNIFRRTLEGKSAPEITGEVWFNQDVLPKPAQARLAARQSLRIKQDLPGMIVLIDFWDYSCVDCIHAFPSMHEWWKRYKDLNFMIIGVHTPEFTYASDSEKVRDAVIRFNISYPVVSDADYATWERYQNTKWPRRLLTDAQGKIRHDFQDKNDYQAIEAHIQERIRDGHPTLSFTDPSSTV